MKSEHILLISGILGIIAFLLLPTWTKIFSFLIPAVALSTVYYQKFNWIIFLTLTLLFVLFPSSLFTQDVSKPFQILRTIDYYEDVVGTLVVVFVVVVPVVGLIGGIYALTIGNAEQGTNAIIKAIATIVIVGVFFFFASLLGWNVFGLDAFKDIFVWMWDFIQGIIDFFKDTLSTLLSDEDKEKIDEIQNQELMDVVSSREMLSLTIASIYPLIISIIAILIVFIHWIMKIPIKKQNITDLQRFNRPNSKDLTFLGFLLAIIVFAFILFLTYSFDSFMNYQTIGFFSIYLLITSISCIFLTFGVGSPTKLSKETVYGTIIGVAILFLYANMFTQTQTLDLMNIEYQNLTSIKILNQFLFVAPTESLLFHVFMPSLVIYYYLQQNRVLTEEELKAELTKIDIEIETLQTSADLHKEFKQPQKYAKTIQIINKKKKEQNALKTKKPDIKPAKIPERDFIIYLVYVFVFNAIFSILHWFKSGISFEVFWSSGIGFLYLSSGMILTLIAYRFGWLSAILAHAVHNSLTLFLITLMGGV